MRTFRKERVARVVQEIVSGALMRHLNDPRIAPLTTVSRVQVTGDLAVATVFFTVPGEESAEPRTLSALRHAAGFLQRLVGQELRMRQTPELRFEVDEAAKKVRETMRLLAENQRQRGGGIDGADGTGESAGDGERVEPVSDGGGAE